MGRGLDGYSMGILVEDETSEKTQISSTAGYLGDLAGTEQCLQQVIEIGFTKDYHFVYELHSVIGKGYRPMINYQGAIGKVVSLCPHWQNAIGDTNFWKIEKIQT